MNLVEHHVASFVRVEEAFRVAQVAPDTRQLAVVVVRGGDRLRQHRLAGAPHSLQPADGAAVPGGMNTVEPDATDVHADSLAFGVTKRNCTGALVSDWQPW